LLTGGTGFIGSHLIQELTQEQFQIVAIVRNEEKFKEKTRISERKNLRVEKILFLTDRELQTLTNERFDAIIHLAAIRGESNVPESEYQRVNVAGTEALLKFARENNIPKFIYISTVGVLGTIPHLQPAGADNEPNPDNKYHTSKWQAEQLVRSYHGTALKTLILRPTITYGTGDNGFIPKMIAMVQKRRFFYPRRPVRIHLLSVRALSDLIVQMLKKNSYDGKAYLVADKSPILLKDLVDLISKRCLGKNYASLFQIPTLAFRAAEKLFDLTAQKQLATSIRLISRDWTYDISETVTKLGYRPKDTFMELSSILIRKNDKE